MDRTRVAVVGVLALAGPSVSWSEGGSNDAVFKTETTVGLEEIYVFRTTRTTRTRGSPPACAVAGFESKAEDFYTLWSIALNSKTAKVTDGHVKPVGSFTACFGATAPNEPFKMFAKGVVSKLQWTGHGECTLMAAQPPALTVRAYNCNLALDGLPDTYAGGWITSSTLAPVTGPNAAPDAHVPGYMSTSLVTLRLWKTPPSAPANK